MFTKNSKTFFTGLLLFGLLMAGSFGSCPLPMPEHHTTAKAFSGQLQQQAQITSNASKCCETSQPGNSFITNVISRSEFLNQASFGKNAAGFGLLLVLALWQIIDLGAVGRLGYYLRLYFRKLFDHFLTALSDGLLQPKIYNA